MKKVLLVIVQFLVSINVYAANSCTYEQIQQAQKDLANVTFSLEYADDYEDENGNFQEGQFRMYFNNIPDDFQIFVDGEYNFSIATNSTGPVTVEGGIYKIMGYLQGCDEPVKMYELNVPYYKQFCDEMDDCEDNVWYDGSISNDTSTNKEKRKNSIQLIIVLILLTLIIVTGALIVIFSKWRKKHEKLY